MFCFPLLLFIFEKKGGWFEEEELIVRVDLRGSVLEEYLYSYHRLISKSCTPVLCSLVLSFLSPSFGWTEVLSCSEVTGEGGPPVFWALYTIDIGLVIFVAITLELFGDLVFFILIFGFGLDSLLYVLTDNGSY